MDDTIYEETLRGLMRAHTRKDFGGYLLEILRRIASDSETAGYRARQAIEAGEGTEADHECADLGDLVRDDARQLAKHIRWMQSGVRNFPKPASDICRDAEYFANRVHRHATDMLCAGGIDGRDHADLLELFSGLSESIANSQKIAEFMALSARRVSRVRVAS